ncbi:MAG: hypothetical protein ACOX1Y_13850 [Zhaonellaceae bacterium]
MQCAEFVPKWIYRFCSLPKKAIAQEVAMMETVFARRNKTFNFLTRIYA